MDVVGHGGGRVLVVTERCLGDSVHTLPMLDLLESRWSHLTLVTHDARNPLYMRPTRTLLSVDKGRGIRNDFRQAAALRKEQFDAAVISKTSFRSAWIARLAGIPKRVGHAMEGRSFLLTDAVPYDRGAYEAFCVLDLARPLGLTVTLKRPRFVIGDDYRDGKDLVGGATIGVQPGASGGDRTILPDVLADVVRRLQDQGHTVAIVGGPREAPYAQALCERLDKPVVDLIGKTTLPQLIGVLSSFQLMIGPDTGVLHLTAALGTTTVQAFGPTPYKKWGNAYGANKVVVASHGRMSDIGADALSEAIEDALDQKRAKKLAHVST